MIYILDNDPKLCAEMLDDRSLDSMIKDIAHVLNGVHYCLRDRDWKLIKASSKPWIYWAIECRANYLYLAKLGIACIDERYDRLGIFEERESGEGPYTHCIEYKKLKQEATIEWAVANVPNLPDILWQGDLVAGHGIYRELQSLPLVVPKKYILHDHDEECYDWTVLRNTLGEADTVVASYRNYYRVKLFQAYRKAAKNIKLFPKWTNQEVPDIWKEVCCGKEWINN